MPPPRRVLTNLRCALKRSKSMTLLPFLLKTVSRCTHGNRQRSGFGGERGSRSCPNTCSPSGTIQIELPLQARRRPGARGSASSAEPSPTREPGQPGHDGRRQWREPVSGRSVRIRSRQRGQRCAPAVSPPKPIPAAGFGGLCPTATARSLESRRPLRRRRKNFDGRAHRARNTETERYIVPTCSGLVETMHQRLESAR
jgi:hypothetical protein